MLKTEDHHTFRLGVAPSVIWLPSIYSLSLILGSSRPPMCDAVMVCKSRGNTWGGQITKA